MRYFVLVAEPSLETSIRESAPLLTNRSQAKFTYLSASLAEVVLSVMSPIYSFNSRTFLIALARYSSISKGTPSLAGGKTAVEEVRGAGTTGSESVGAFPIEMKGCSAFSCLLLGL